MWALFSLDRNIRQIWSSSAQKPNKTVWSFWFEESQTLAIKEHQQWKTRGPYESQELLHERKNGVFFQGISWSLMVLTQIEARESIDGWKDIRTFRRSGYVFTVKIRRSNYSHSNANDENKRGLEFVVHRKSRLLMVIGGQWCAQRIRQQRQPRPLLADKGDA